MFHLQFYRQKKLLFSHGLRSDTLIGRSDRCDVSLPSVEISRRHCRFVQEGKIWHVEDLSTHGIRLNGEKIARAEVCSGDEIQILDFTCRFVMGWESEQRTEDVPLNEEYSFVLHTDTEIHAYVAEIIVEQNNKVISHVELNKHRVGLGAEGSDIWIEDERLKKNHTYLRVSRSRVMVEPGFGIAKLEGQSISVITPLYPQDELRIGDSIIRITHTVSKKRPLRKSFGQMQSVVPSVQALFGKLKKFSQHHFHVLLIGESGTGKELAARAIHENSSRRDAPFVAINCGALPKDLIESELFGHERGAFTGALSTRKGAFQQAHKGTLFLDELGELDANAQVKLLRVLESGEIRKVGSHKSEYPDVRIIAATNRNLEEMMSQGSFRSDLYFRIACLCGWIPPLRERVEDIDALAQDILSSIEPKAILTPSALQLLRNHAWPGNVRELRNVLIRSFVVSGLEISAEDIDFQQLLPNRLHPKKEENEERYLRFVLDKHGGNRSAVARELGLSRSTLIYRLKRYGL